MTTFQIKGRVIDPKTRLGVAALSVEAWDKDLIFDDILGSSITDKDGAFNITFDGSDLKDLFEQTPDLFFRVYAGARLIKSTENSILWNVNAGEIPIIIEVDMNTDTVKKLPPDLQPIKPMQAQRLALLTGLKAETFVNKTVAELSEKLKWHIDPKYFLFRRICGKVVKTDPATGIDYPVPGATVHVWDTDCSFLGLFPVESPWAWLFPIFCHKEEIGTATTNACGEFCVWVPRFEIDWMLRWRIERRCLWDLLVKPNLSDLLKHLELIPKPGPGPDPDPGPLLARNPNAIRQIATFAGAEAAQRIQAIAQSSLISYRSSETETALARRVFDRPLPPPIPTALNELHSTFLKEGPQALAAHVGCDREYQLDLKRYAGPFLRPLCWYEIKTEWQPLVDIPDITFTVTQDVDGDGAQEDIYSEKFFDVRWNAGDISPVTLHASQIAVASPLCGSMPNIDCAETGQGAGIKGVSLMQVDPGYIDPATGYAIRPNRPHVPDGLVRGRAFALADPAATAPFAGTLLLRGCNQIQSAAFYRLLYKHNGGPEVPFLNLSWPIFRPLGSPPTWVNPVDGNGWYNILPDPANWSIPYLLLAWPSYAFQPGAYELRVELANAGKNNLAYSNPIHLNVDNSSPIGSITMLKWRKVGDSDADWKDLSLSCPTVRRSAGTNIEFQVTWQASASHLLYTQLSAQGCGSSTANLSLQTPPETAEHWYKNEADNTLTQTAVYRLNYSAVPSNEGAYTFWIDAYSRAIDPSHATGYVADWNYNVLWIGGTMYLKSVAVVDL